MKKAKRTKGGMLIPIKPLTNGTWLPPEEARKYEWNGRGIGLKTCMNNIYAGVYQGRVKNENHTWFMWVTFDVIENYERQKQLLAA